MPNKIYSGVGSSPIYLLKCPKTIWVLDPKICSLFQALQFHASHSRCFPLKRLSESTSVRVLSPSWCLIYAWGRCLLLLTVLLIFRTCITPSYFFFSAVIVANLMVPISRSIMTVLSSFQRDHWASRAMQLRQSNYSQKPSSVSTSQAQFSIWILLNYFSYFVRFFIKNRLTLRFIFFSKRALDGRNLIMRDSWVDYWILRPSFSIWL